MTSSEEDCPFCAIVKAYPHPATNSIPEDSEPAAHIILSTPHVLAFLDHLPLTKCHAILIPRAHFELLTDIPSPYAAELGRVLPIISRAVVQVSGADGFNVVQNNGVSSGQVVPHSHFHVVPRFREYTSASMFGKGQREELDDEEGREVAGKMRAVIERELQNDKSKL